MCIGSMWECYVDVFFFEMRVRCRMLCIYKKNFGMYDAQYKSKNNFVKESIPACSFSFSVMILSFFSFAPLNVNLFSLFFSFSLSPLSLF